MAQPPDSSRDSTVGAGWHCRKGGYEGKMGSRAARRRFSWLSPKPLLDSRNDRIARNRFFGDPTAERRRAWGAGLDPSDDFTVSLPPAPGDGKRDQVSFIVAGDTGEGDASQFAVVEPMRKHLDGAEFLWICSDVIYPAGGTNEYAEKFCRPYQDLDAQIYAIPGNHDWYDDLTGFMYWFCGQGEAPAWPPAPCFSRRWLRQLLWRRPPAVDKAKLAKAEALLAPPAKGDAPQPGPYFALDVGPVLLVGIDTGIEGDLDYDQGHWLRRVSRESEKPKILLTGKPLYVDGKRNRGRIRPNDAGEGGGWVDDVVENPAHGYLAAIGGDIHNYQRYPVATGDGRTLMCVVSGGGGAFMHETHTIPNLDSLTDFPVSESEFRCYPLRGDSLSRYSKLYGEKLLGALWVLLGIDPDVASKLMAERLGREAKATVEPTRESARAAEPTWRDRLAARLIFLIHHRGRGDLHVPFSEWLDWNEPPMFKHFLRVDANDDEVRIRCFAATGCAPHEADPPLEDELLASRRSDGSWDWTFPEAE